MSVQIFARMCVMRTRSWTLAIVASLLLVLVGCGDSDPEEANPASVFCIEQGGELDIVTEEDGEVGYCILPDGTRVDEWEYFEENAPTDP